MAELEIKNFGAPDDRTGFDHGEVELLHLTTGTVGRAVLQPGWRWSEHVKPIVKTEWCEETHVGLVVSGRMHVRMSSGEEREIGPGDVGLVPPGHDAWVVGDEACVSVDWTGMADFGKP
jgi:mannose-6-phosphate isomerase-like protein (cupin superfamily)